MKTNISEKLEAYYEKYDTLDIISKLGALNLEFENQNKNPLSSYATVVGLFCMNDGKPKASNKTIKLIIDDLNESSIMPPIQDPSESPFYEFVYLDKEYKVFNGINTSSAFYVNSIIELLLYRKTKLCESFKDKLIKLIKASLYISNSVYVKAKINVPIDKDHQYHEDMLFSNKIDIYQKALFFNKKDLEALVSNEDLEKYFYCSTNGRDLKKCLDQTYPFYYDAPLLDCGETVLLIDPTSICVFIKNLSLRLAKEYGCESVFMDELYAFVFDYSLERCKMLSGVHHNSENLIIKTKEKRQWTIAYSFGNKVFLFIFFVCDGTLGRNADSIIKKAFSELKDKGYKDGNRIFTTIIIGSLGENSSFSSGYRFKNQPLIIPFTDLEAVQINEKDDPFFIVNFINFLNFYFPDDKMSMVFSMTNLIGMVHEKGYDFYYGDDINVRSALINLAFDCIYPYCVKALKEHQNSVASYLGMDSPIRLIKYEDNIYFPNPILCPIISISPLYVKIGSHGMWINSKREDETGLLVSRTLAYWLNQISDTIEKYLHQDYYLQVALVEDEMSMYLFDDIHGELRYTRKYIESFGNDNNRNEIAMVCNILELFNILNDDILSKLNVASSVTHKKIIYTINTEHDPFLKPLLEPTYLIRCCKLYSGIIDDLCGDYIRNNLKVNFGVISSPGDVINLVVKEIFYKFTSFIDRFNWKQSLMKCYLYSEKSLFDLLMYQDNLKHQFALYPEHAKEIEEHNDAINVTSIGTRFIVEYLAAVNTSGDKIMDEIDIQYAISLVESIIRWAKLSDGYKYKLIDSFSFFQSGRVGYDHKNMLKFNKLLSSVAFNDSIKKINSFNYQPDEFPFEKEVDDAYCFEHGFTTSQLLVAVTIIIICGENQKEEIKSATIDDLLSVLHSGAKTDVDDSTFCKIINYLSIDFRGEYYDKKITPRELHPWKYGREWSLMRKPIVRRDGICYWGNRMIYHSYMFITQTIRSGKEPSHDKSKKGIGFLNGKILEYIGEEFNNYCFNYLKNMLPEFMFDKCVKSINSKSVKNDKGETLGDIDILAIDNDKKRIYLIEAKRFYYSRNPSELDNEIKDMFVGTDKRKSFLAKELLRKQWVENHIDDVIKHYKLVGNGWTVKYTFLTFKPLISTAFVKTPINHIDLKNISLKYLRKLK